MDVLSELQNLISAIAHKIRTPLSIIQNELTCIKSKVTEEEYQTLMAACKNINNILKEPVENHLSNTKLNKNE